AVDSLTREATTFCNIDRMAPKEKRASMSTLDPPLSPIAEEGPLRKVSNFKRFFSTRSQRKKMTRSLTFDTASLDNKDQPDRPRNLSLNVPPDDCSDPGVNSASSSSAASTCSDSSYGRTISSDGAGLLEPISSQTKAYSCSSLNSNGNTDETDGPLRMHISRDGDCLSRDPRTVSKHKYFSPNGDRNFLSKYITPTFHERSIIFRKLFHELVPPDEQMLASFSCAYQREILVHGRIFISSRHFCFHANIFGWGTIFVIPMKDVVDITKEKTMFMFPNSIQLNTEGKGRFFFASFTNRDKSLKVMQHAWAKINESGKALEPDELWELMNPANSETRPTNSETKEKQKEKEKTEKTKSKPEKKSSKRKKGSVSVSSADEPTMLKTCSAPILEPVEQQRAAAGACTASLDETDAAERSSSTSTTDVSFSECTCDDHFGKKLLDQVFPRSPSELFDLIFTSSPWYDQLSTTLKRTEHAKMPLKYSGYSASDWATDKDGVRLRTCTYTMSLNHAMAPKSTNVTEKQVYKAFRGGYTIVKETVNSGVPYSDSFHVSCTYCIMGYGRGQARLVVHGGLVFTKSVWGMIRGYIERSTTAGLADHYEALYAALTEECKRSGAGSDGLALEDDQNRMDTSSEEGGDAETSTVGNLRGMAGSISGINFMHHSARVNEEAYFHLPLLGRMRRLDFYGVGILSLLALMSLTLIILVLRLPSHSADSRLVEAFHRYLSPDSAHYPPSDATHPDLDSLIAAIGRIGAQLQQVRNAVGNNAHQDRGEL
ncbi:hypothetical protein PMAYCL1PPCAC_21072, partial [Pristionchus mayeri]